MAWSVVQDNSVNSGPERTGIIWPSKIGKKVFDFAAGKHIYLMFEMLPGGG